MENQNQKKQATSDVPAAEAASATDTAGSTANGNAAGTSAGAAPSGDSFDALMEQSPVLCPVGKWLKCLRKPAISLEYSISKRHIPDLDEMPQSTPSASGTAGGTGTKGTAQAASGTKGAGKGQNSDIMDMTGGFTIRYFDLTVGVMGIALLGCLWKGCCCLKRIMK